MATNKLPTKEQLESKLRQLAAPCSPAEVATQMALLVMVCRLNEQRPQRPRLPKPVSSQMARVQLIISQVHALTPAQRNYLLGEIERIEDEDFRLGFLAQLAPHMPTSKRQAFVESIWRGVKGVGTATARANLLFNLFTPLDDLQNTPSASFMAIYNIARRIPDRDARTRSLIALAQHVPPAFGRRIQVGVLDIIEDMPRDTARCNALVSLASTLHPTLNERAHRVAQALQTPEERARALTYLATLFTGTTVDTIRMETLDTIEEITGEEARTDALAAYADLLGDVHVTGDNFPPILERALLLAVSLPRRAFRARALVALAPHLPPDLQGEAIAAVNDLRSDRERADQLAELAPRLAPDMLVASLAIAHTMQQQDARVYALTTLAHHVPEQARQQTLLDALAAASNLPRQFERVLALVNLLDILPEALQEQACTNALEATRLIDNPNTRARALNMITTNLPMHLLPRAREIATTLQDPQRKLSTLEVLVNRLPENERAPIYQQMLEIVSDIRYEYRQSRALLAVAEQLPAQLIPQATELARNIDDPYDRVSALIALAQNTPTSDRLDLLREAWRLLRKVESGYDRASALAAISPLLPSGAEADLTRAISGAIGSITDPYDQASAIILLAPLLAQTKPHHTPNLPDKSIVLRDGLRVAIRASGQAERAALLATGVALWQSSYTPDETAVHDMLWRDVIPRIGTLPLADAALCVESILPILRHLAGPGGVTETLRAFGLPE